MLSLTRLLVLLLATGIGASGRKNKYIVPGATWYDTDGQILSAHAGGIVEHEGRWYWFGQNERQEDKDLFSGINVYSSDDLLDWKNEGRALSPVPGTDIAPDLVAERPKAVFDPVNKNWVLWFHSDNSTYGLLRQGVATSPNITGPYEFQKAFSPLGGTSQDFGLFQDVDGSAYALYSNGDDPAAHDNLISRMKPGFTDLEEVVYTFLDFDLEAPAIVFSGKRYYILMSHKTGYRPNNVVVFSAEKLAGPWSIQSYVAPSGTRTFNSQSTMAFAVNGSHETTILYCGDQWATAKDLYESTYIWLPAEVDDRTGSFTIGWHDLYSIDVNTGKVTYPEGQTYEAEDGVVTGSAYKTVCCAQHSLETHCDLIQVFPNSSITIDNIVGTGNPQWVSLYYHNPDGLCTYRRYP
ncbi:carbohydrate-binding module family 35 protein [Macrolepiota fuliginosa MF-IS2]|uniref:Carbohydrate-binding module family 35 protein n=1 Tax=Macrolepiota fuliginosa MF-IS2 TaxID=1400762 RepID=A0A9P6C626_9AGAR|nr:carbohydrate-binding module family 35 protein [Macrolepiota fuliginosa MF-IS2]